MKLKIFLAAALAAVFALTGCEKKTEQSDEEARQAVMKASRQELEQALADRDSLLSLVGDISTGVTNIKQIEAIISVDKGETPSQKRQLANDLAAIQQTLADRRSQLEELEKKLQSSSIYSTKLQNTITSLRTQIEEQSKEIERLTTELAAANERIGELNTQVDSLHTTVTNVTDERNAAQQQAVETANEMNTCYYVVATDKALKEHNIIEKGFLRKTKIMKGDFDQSFFTTADKRSLRFIETKSKKAEIMTNQPAGSYEIADTPTGKVIRILQPNKFWSLSNYLVVKID